MPEEDALARGGIFWPEGGLPDQKGMAKGDGTTVGAFEPAGPIGPVGPVARDSSSGEMIFFWPWNLGLGSLAKKTKKTKNTKNTN